MNPRSISESKRAEAVASKLAKAAKAADRANKTPDTYRAYHDANVSYMDASHACYLLKRRRHGGRGLGALGGRDAVSIRVGREIRGRKATDDRKAERQLRRDAERAERVEREEQARAAELAQAEERAEVERLYRESATAIAAWSAAMRAGSPDAEALHQSAGVAFDAAKEARRNYVNADFDRAEARS